MTFVVADRVKETTTTTGTGALTLAGAMAGHKAFSSRCAVGDTCYYCIQAVDSAGQPTGDWEVGLGTYSAASTLTRTTVLASSNADAAVSLAAGTKQVYITLPAAQAKWMREKLTAARTYYVRTDGNDANTGLANAAGGAFLTVQKAIDTISASIDLGGFSVTVQMADGTYTTPFAMKPVVGGNKITVQGNATTPANVVVSTAASAISSLILGLTLGVKDMTVQTSAGHGLLAANGGKIEFGNLRFGSCASFHMACTTGAAIAATDNYTIVGGAAVHHYFESYGMITVSSRTVTLTGTPAFSSYFAGGSFAGAALLNANTYSGSATGKRYQLSGNTTINVMGAAVTYLPGDVPGTTATGGQYV